MLYYVEYANGNCSIVESVSPERIRSLESSTTFIRPATTADLEWYERAGGFIWSAA